MSVKRLDSAWGVLLPFAIVPVMALMELSFNQWRGVMVIALLATISMLYHKKLRHYLLLPSCMALAGCLVAISLKFVAW